VRKHLLAGVVVCILALAGLAVWQRDRLPAALGGRRLPNVLLISIDTLRADRLGCYGYREAQTPTLDALAARGLRFSQATTVTPLTLPAHASLLTGTFPNYHGVRDNGQFYLSDDATTLAEVLKPRGYRTGGFIGAFVLDRRWGIAQGFDTYFDNFDLSKYELAAGIDAAQRPGREVVDHALAWFRQDASKPFFAWVHIYDPHAPYAAPDEIAARFPQTMSGGYDAEVAEADIQVGRLIEALRDDKRLENTLIVVVGDHGESLGDHREQQHGFFVYDATIHIPLIIAGPQVPTHVISDQVRIVDVMPTVLEAVGVPKSPTAQGSSLLPAARGQHLKLLALSESWYPRYHYGWSELVSVRDGRYKFIAAPRRELYDTEGDPGETKNLAVENPRLADAMDRVLRDMSSRMTGTSQVRGPQAVDPDVEERLRALGYVGSSVSPRNLEERPRGDPKDKIALYNLLKLAGSDSVAGRLDDAIGKVQQVLAEDAEVVEAYVMLGNLHMKGRPDGRHPETAQGRPEGRPVQIDQAIAAYQKALTLDDRNENAAFALALAYKQKGQLDAAVAGFQRVLQINARSTKSEWQLADIWMRRGDFGRAEQALSHALTMNVDRPAFLLKLGEAQIQLSKIDEAEKHLREAIRLKPDLPMANYDLGVLLEARNDPARAVEAYEAELKVNSSSYQAHFNVAKLYARAGRVKDAVHHFQRAVDANPTFGSGYLYLAKALLDAGDLNASEAAALKGIAANPDPQVRPLGHYVLADVYTRMGRGRDAARQAAIGRRLERGSE
jgi:arylsulfatase A-like enzyme/tetratricopeptide (TPR) repeat protein